MKIRWQKFTGTIRIVLATALAIWVLAFILRNLDRSTEVDWVFVKSPTNVAAVILASLVVGLIVGIAIHALARRRPRY